ncbi:MAG: hypothetical protein IKA18_02350 [Clostridia bacterium]|nr:hypothetical protein [Clostridia bacterium]MBR2875183.1 hypothetical protein [Clostridia bacterium]
MEQNAVVKSHKGKKIASMVLTILCVLFFAIAVFCSTIIISEYFESLELESNLSYGIAFAIFIAPNIFACALQLLLFIVNLFLLRPIFKTEDIKDKKRATAKLIITGALYVVSSVLCVLCFMGAF